MVKVNKLTLSSKEYPEQLKHIPDPPRELYFVGEVSALSADRMHVAVVGSRKPTTYGREVAHQLVTPLANYGLPIVSGLALGVDALAHRAALQAGGPTIAVLPCGLDNIYPRSHYQLAQQILAQGGALVSEYPPGTPPVKRNFIARNRIVTGLSKAVLIVEAAQKSGTLHTARFALEQGRSVMAVPGNINAPQSQGTNRLITQGARCITESSDILDELGVHTAPQQQRIPLGANAEESRLIELLAEGITDGKDLLKASKLDVTTFNQALTMLEITGKIRANGADSWSIT